MGHSHDHTAGRAEDRARLRLVLLVTVLVAAVELVGAWWSGSLALLADAGHMVTDATGVLLALSASLVATLPVSDRRTFGLHRAEILAALVNALVLLGVCGYLLYAGIRHLVDPGEVHAGQLLVFAAVGLAANLVSLALLAGRREESLNMRGAFLEVASDCLGSVAAIVAGLVIAANGFLRADAIASLVIAMLILPRSFSLLREALEVLLEFAPEDLDVEAVRSTLLAIDGVTGLHDLHCWTITSGMPALSVHVVVRDEVLAERGVGPVLDDLAAATRDGHGIDHATFQVEPDSHREHEHLGEAEHP